MKILLSISCILVSACTLTPIKKSHHPKSDHLGSLYIVDADPKRGFNFAFFLYIPTMAEKNPSLLVIPNNSGSSKLSYDSQINHARREALSWSSMAKKTSSILLVPTFPRPDVVPPIYTHALSRAALEVRKGNLKRIDLQLLKMIEAAKSVIAEKESKIIKKKVFLFGFSASAMFVNRFTFIHPEAVAAVALGSPGGWPIAPTKIYKKQKLIYPVGIQDLESIVKTPINLDKIAKVPMFLFLGENDENDSVVYRDSYTEENEIQIFKLFGKKPVDRWTDSKNLYKKSKLNATFKLYPGMGHETNKAIHEDIVSFFNKVNR
jgi:predicted esterase